MLAFMAFFACTGEEKASPVSVEDMCQTFDYGDDDASDDAKAGLERTNCYRHLMGLDAAELEPHLDIAAQQHAEYMATNSTLTHEEDKDADGYTGDWVWDRAETAGYDLAYNTVMSEVVSQGYGPAAAVDGWINSVYHRIPFTVPDVVATGFGQQDRYSSMAFVTEYTSASAEAVIYPVDGQTDVPPSFNSDFEEPDPAPGASYVGPPITVTVSSKTAPGTDTNPFVLVLRDASLSGPDGDVDLITLTPDSDDYMFQAVALVPSQALQPDADYEATVSITWTGGEETLTASFHTAAE